MTNPFFGFIVPFLKSSKKCSLSLWIYIMYICFWFMCFSIIRVLSQNERYTLVNKRIEQAIFVMPWVNFMNMFLPVARDKIYDSWIDHMDIQTKASDWSIYLVFCWDDTCRYGLLIPICKSYSANWNNPRGLWSCHQPGVRLFQWRFMSQVRFFSQLSWPLRKVQLELFVRIFGGPIKKYQEMVVK